MQDLVIQELNRLPASTVAKQMLAQEREPANPQALYLSQLLTVWLEKQPAEAAQEIAEVEEVLQATSPVQLAAMLTPNYEETYLALNPLISPLKKVRAIAPFLQETYRLMLDAGTFQEAGQVLVEHLLNSREEVYPNAAPQHLLPSV